MLIIVILTDINVASLKISTEGPWNLSANEHTIADDLSQWTFHTGSASVPIHVPKLLMCHWEIALPYWLTETLPTQNCVWNLSYCHKCFFSPCSHNLFLPVIIIILSATTQDRVLAYIRMSHHWLQSNAATSIYRRQSSWYQCSHNSAIWAWGNQLFFFHQAVPERDILLALTGPFLLSVRPILILQVSA